MPWLRKQFTAYLSILRLVCEENLKIKEKLSFKCSRKQVQKWSKLISPTFGRECCQRVSVYLVYISIVWESTWERRYVLCVTKLLQDELGKRAFPYKVSNFITFRTCILFFFRGWLLAAIKQNKNIFCQLIQIHSSKY